MAGGKKAKLSHLPRSICTALLLWPVLVWVSWKAIYEEVKPFEPAIDLDEEHEAKQAEFLLDAAHRSVEHTDNKARQLLTLSSALATLLVIFGAQGEPAWLVVAAVIALLCSVLLAVMLLGVRVEMIPNPEGRQADPRGSQWARDVIKSSIFTRRRHLYLVDLYAGARRWLIIALLLLPMLLVCS